MEEKIEALEKRIAALELALKDGENGMNVINNYVVNNTLDNPAESDLQESSLFL